MLKDRRGSGDLARSGVLALEDSGRLGISLTEEEEEVAEWETEREGGEGRTKLGSRRPGIIGVESWKLDFQYYKE